MDNVGIDVLALRSFCALMDERSVSRAAVSLGLSQPTMSRMLARLRTYFADPLLVWAGRSMTPTPRALALEGELRDVLATLERLASPDRPFDPRTSEARLMLAATGYTENIFLTDVMKKVAAQAPGVTLEVRAPNRLQDTAALERGEIDFVIGWTMTPAASLRSRFLFNDRVVCIARKGHPMLRDSELTYERYIALPHVQYEVPGKTTTGLLLEEKLSREGHHRRVSFRIQSSLTVGEVVASSDLIATLPHRFAARFLDRYPIEILDLPIRLPPMQNRAFWHERMQSDPRSRWFRRLLAEVARTL